MTAVRLVIGDGRIEIAAISVGACAPVAVRLFDIEAGLQGMPCSDAAAYLRDSGPAIMAALSPIDDIRGTAGYRREAAAELVARLVGELCGEAG